jgi:hypothetical protein
MEMAGPAGRSRHFTGSTPAGPARLGILLPRHHGALVVVGHKAVLAQVLLALVVTEPAVPLLGSFGAPSFPTTLPITRAARVREVCIRRRSSARAAQRAEDGACPGCEYGGCRHDAAPRRPRRQLLTRPPNKPIQVHGSPPTAYIHPTKSKRSGLDMSRTWASSSRRRAKRRAPLLPHAVRPSVTSAPPGHSHVQPPRRRSSPCSTASKYSIMAELHNPDHCSATTVVIAREPATHSWLLGADAAVACAASQPFLPDALW